MNIYEARANKIMLQWTVLGQAPRGELRERAGAELTCPTDVDLFTTAKELDGSDYDQDDTQGRVEFKPTPNHGLQQSMTYSGNEETGEVTHTMVGSGGCNIQNNSFSPTHRSEVWCMTTPIGDQLTVTEYDLVNPENSTSREWFLSRQ